MYVESPVSNQNHKVGMAESQDVRSTTSDETTWLHLKSSLVRGVLEKNRHGELGSEDLTFSLMVESRGTPPLTRASTRTSL